MTRFSALPSAGAPVGAARSRGGGRLKPPVAPGRPISSSRGSAASCWRGCSGCSGSWAPSSLRAAQRFGPRLVSGKVFDNSAVRQPPPGRRDGEVDFRSNGFAVRAHEITLRARKRLAVGPDGFARRGERIPLSNLDRRRIGGRGPTPLDHLDGERDRPDGAQHAKDWQSASRWPRPQTQQRFQQIRCPASLTKSPNRRATLPVRTACC